jgi:hypothetical protein
MRALLTPLDDDAEHPVGRINGLSCCGGLVFVDESAEELASSNYRR